MRKWMVFMRESDGIHFLYNGEGCIRISPIILGITGADETPKWHDEYGQLSDIEWAILRSVTLGRQRGFELNKRGRYQVIARGEFKEL